MWIKTRRRQKSCGKLFNGNIYNEGEFILIWLLILAYIVGMWLFMLKGTSPVNENNCENISLTIKSVNITSDEKHRKIDFTVYENSREYTVSGWAADMESFAADIHDGSSINVVLEGKKIVSLYNEEKYYLMTDDINQQRMERRKASYIMLVFAGAWVLYIAISWYVMYNAEKYPRLVKWFVKPYYINKNKIRKGS